MKKLMVLAAVAMSVTTFSAQAAEAITGAYAVMSVTGSSVGISSSIYGPDCMLGQGACKAAVQVLEDSQKYMQSGEVTAYLSQKIKEVQDLDSSLSADEALDALVASAEKFVK